MSTYAYAHGGAGDTAGGKRVLVAYFSATGTTAAVAERLAAVTGGDLCEIVPAAPYTAADLDWHDSRSRSSVEMNDPESRPEIVSPKVEVSGYDVVFIGYPIWWDLAPRAVNTFIESFDFGGKVLVPFATSGGSSITNSAAALKREYPKYEWRTGRLLNGADEGRIRNWVAGLGL